MSYLLSSCQIITQFNAVLIVDLRLQILTVIMVIALWMIRTKPYRVGVTSEGSNPCATNSSLSDI